MKGYFAELLTELTKQDRAAFFNSGTEAVMVAIRLARANSSKSKIVIFKDAYHGSLDSLLVLKTNSSSNQAEKLIPGIPQELLDLTYQLDYGTDESIEFIKKHSFEIGAVLVEPLQSRVPENFNPVFLGKLREVTLENEIPLIFDEVISGFRFSNGGIQEILNIKPDITTYGKIVGGGLPVGVVAGKNKYMQFIDGGFWDYNTDTVPSMGRTFVAGTFCHHPLMIASSIAVLERLKQNKGELQRRLNKKTDSFCKELNSLLVEYTDKISLVNYGSLFRIVIKNKKYFKVYFELQKNGVYLWEGRNCFLSFEHSNEALDLLKSSIIKSIKTVL